MKSSDLTGEFHNMKIIEIDCTADKGGGLKIPCFVLNDMGINAGDHIRLAYLSEKGEINTFHEFFLSPNGLASIHSDSDAQSIRVPDELMSKAGISENADVQILCSRQMIIIYQSGGVLRDDLEIIRNNLQNATETMSSLVSQIRLGSRLDDLMKNDI